MACAPIDENMNKIDKTGKVLRQLSDWQHILLSMAEYIIHSMQFSFANSFLQCIALGATGMPGGNAPRLVAVAHGNEAGKFARRPRMVGHV